MFLMEQYRCLIPFTDVIALLFFSRTIKGTFRQQNQASKNEKWSPKVTRSRLKVEKLIYFRNRA